MKRKILTNINIDYHCRKDDKFYSIRPDIPVIVPDYVCDYLLNNYRNNMILLEKNLRDIKIKEEIYNQSL